ncbi:MAG: hypothetical protein DRJ64_01620 [Thermoprotei archaeon]|nr:MAG: hypothetical protein DRJ64_01620 [Thermoprotei archaeon]
MLKEMSPIQSNEDGILSKLYRKVLIETGFINSVNYFINRYDGKKNRTTISRLILSGEMTWNSFTFLTLTILQAKYIELEITIKKDGETHTVTVKQERDSYIEKEAGKLLRRSVELLLRALSLEDKTKELIGKYYRSGGKKNKATIPKILDSESISWKSYIFLIFELISNTNVDMVLNVKNVHGKVTTHKLLIKKND